MSLVPAYPAICRYAVAGTAFGALTPAESDSRPNMMDFIRCGISEEASSRVPDKCPEHINYRFHAKGRSRAHLLRKHFFLAGYETI